MCIVYTIFYDCWLLINILHCLINRRLVVESPISLSFSLIFLAESQFHRCIAKTIYTPKIRF